MGVGGSAGSAVGLGSELAVVPGIEPERSGFVRTLGELGVSLPSRNLLSQGKVELSVVCL